MDDKKNPDVERLIKNPCPPMPERIEGKEEDLRTLNLQWAGPDCPDGVMDYGAFIGSTKIDKVWGSLVKAQAKIKTVKKTGFNPHFNSAYAEFSAIVEEVRPHLAEFGLGFSQNLMGSRLYSVLFHESGQWIAGFQEVKQDRPGVQQFGSALTYSRRYQLGPQVGCAVGEEDDDGEAAEGRPKYEPCGTEEQKPKDLEQRIIRFGFNKEKRYSEVSTEDLQKGLDWIGEKDPKDHTSNMRTYWDEATKIISARNAVNETSRPVQSPTKQQLMDLAKLAQEKGITPKDLTDFIDFEFGKISSQELTLIEYNVLLNHVKGGDGGSTEEK